LYTVKYLSIIFEGTAKKRDTSRKTTVVGKHHMCLKHEEKQQQQIKITHFLLRPTKNNE
jgi:hypothetical protein